MTSRSDVEDAVMQMIKAAVNDGDPEGIHAEIYADRLRLVYMPDGEPRVFDVHVTLDDFATTEFALYLKWRRPLEGLLGVTQDEIPPEA